MSRSASARHPGRSAAANRRGQQAKKSRRQVVLSASISIEYGRSSRGGKNLGRKEGDGGRPQGQRDPSQLFGGWVLLAGFNAGKRALSDSGQLCHLLLAESQLFTSRANITANNGPDFIWLHLWHALSIFHRYRTQRSLATWFLQKRRGTGRGRWGSCKQNPTSCSVLAYLAVPRHFLSPRAQLRPSLDLTTFGTAQPCDRSAERVTGLGSGAFFCISLDSNVSRITLVIRATNSMRLRGLKYAGRACLTARVEQKT